LYSPGVSFSVTKVDTSCPKRLKTFSVTNSDLGIENSMVVVGLKGLG